MSGEGSSGYNEGTVETAVGAAIIALSIIVVALRFYTRIYLKSGLGWDDWLSLVALSGNIAAAILVLAASIIDPNSYWLEDTTDPNYHYTDANKTHLLLAWLSSILYFTLASAAKLSILLLYNRIFSPSPIFRLQIAVLNTIIILFWLSTTIASIFSCWPLKYSWTTVLSPAPYCYNANIFWVVTGIIEAVFDICIILLPIKMVMGLQMSTKRKMSLVLIFSLGAFGIVTGIIKVYQGYAPGKRSPALGQTETWGAVHGGMGITCSCLPVCWPIILMFCSKIKHTVSDRWSTGSTGSFAKSWWRSHMPSYTRSSAGQRGVNRLSTPRDEWGGYIRSPSHDNLRHSPVELLSVASPGLESPRNQPKTANYGMYTP